jgi:hypothetical protein
MTREERKAATLEKRQRIKEERAEARKELKSWNWMIRKLKKKGAIIEETVISILGIIFVLFFLTACTKGPVNNCNSAALLSDKYTLDSVFVKTDTLWKDDCIPYKEFIKIRDLAPAWYIGCYPNNYLECLRYVIGDKITYPIIFKP